MINIATINKLKELAELYEEYIDEANSKEEEINNDAMAAEWSDLILSAEEALHEMLEYIIYNKLGIRFCLYADKIYESRIKLAELEKKPKDSEVSLDITMEACLLDLYINGLLKIINNL